MRTVEQGVILQRLDDLTAEAARLNQQGDAMKPNNPVLRALLADLDPVLRRNAAYIDAASADVQASAIQAASTLTRELALPGLNDQQLAGIGVRWANPDPEAVHALVQYTSSDAFETSLTKYQTGIRDVVRNVAIRGIADGQNPLQTARDIRRAVQGLPPHYANSLMRTLQLESYRSASAISQQANSDILEGAIRVATLDARTCLTCIALHGTALGVGQKVESHHQCRCVSVPIVRGRPRTVQTGVDWFTAQSAARQREIMGAANYAAYADGAVTLQDYVQPYQDPVFGSMLRQASLKGILGAGAKQYYAR